MSLLPSRSSSILSRQRDVYRKIYAACNNTLSSMPTQVKHIQDDNRVSSLTRTEIRKLRVAPLREELAKRGLDISGTRPVLLSRLLATVDSNTGRRDSSSESLSQLDPDRTYVLRVTAHRSSSHRDSSGVGLVLYDATTVREVWVARKYFPFKQTPFESEYRGAILGLEYALSQGATRIVLQTDNEVMIRQIRGEYSVKKESLRKLCQAAAGILERFEDYEMTHITAAENTRAKNLARRAVGTKKSIGLPDDGDTSPMPNTENDSVCQEEESSTVISPEKTYLLRFDGGSRGNPGVAGSGMVLYEADDNEMQELWCGWQYLGPGHTNNAAEYHALLLGMKCAISLGVRKLRVEGDSQLVERHIKGIYRIKDPRMKELYLACREVFETLDFFEIEHICREDNKRADQLANQAMDTEESFGFEEYV